MYVYVQMRESIKCVLNCLVESEISECDHIAQRIFAIVLIFDYITHH